MPHRTAFWVCVAASNVPDVDFVLRFLGEDRYVFEHRGITHSLVGGLLIAPLVAAIAAAFSKRPLGKAFWPLLGIAGAGVAGHLFLDLITSWGTMLLLPFSHVRLSLPWVFILDVWVWLILGVPLLVGWWRRRRGPLPDRILRRTSLTALSFFAAYVALCALGYGRARQAALADALNAGLEPTEVKAWPVPGGPLLWTTAVRTTDQTWRRGFASALTGGVTEAGSFPTGLDDPRVQVALDTKIGSSYRWFADALYLADATPMGDDGSYSVTLADLRFSGPIWPGVPFAVRLRIGSDFALEDWSFGTGRIPEEQPVIPHDQSVASPER